MTSVNSKVNCFRAMYVAIVKNDAERCNWSTAEYKSTKYKVQKYKSTKYNSTKVQSTIVQKYKVQ